MWHPHGEDNGLFEEGLGVAEAGNVVPFDVGGELDNVAFYDVYEVRFVAG